MIAWVKCIGRDAEEDRYLLKLCRFVRIRLERISRIDEHISPHPILITPYVPQNSIVHSGDTLNYIRQQNHFTPMYYVRNNKTRRDAELRL